MWMCIGAGGVPPNTKPREGVVRVTTRCGHVYLCTYDGNNPKVGCSVGGRAGGLQPPQPGFKCGVCMGKQFKAEKDMDIGDIGGAANPEHSWVASVERVS